jgi:hypothetical protein
MACNRNALACRAASVAAGISPLSSQTGNIIGGVTAKITGASDAITLAMGQAIAPVSNRIIEAVDRPSTLAINAAGPVLAALASTVRVEGGRVGVAVTRTRAGEPPTPVIGAGAVLSLRPDAGKRIGRLWAIRQLGRQTGSVAVAIASGITAVTDKPGQDRTLKQTRRTILGQKGSQVVFSQSPFSRYLNQGNSLLSRKHVVSVEGELIHYDRQSLWHRSTTVVQMPDGPKRTITHLQCLAPVPTSYYFDRPLPDKIVASIVSGQQRAYELPGYAGGVTGLERLTPIWARTKRHLILTKLHWPDQWPSWQTE